MGIKLTDTHAHLYAEEFDGDRDEVLLRAKQSGVERIVLPNIDSSSLQPMLDLEARYPEYCYAAIGLHPTSVNETYRSELAIVEQELKRRPYIAIGEIGIDLYWDTTYLSQQQEAFAQQLSWSLEYHLPVIIHVRDSFDATLEVISQFKGRGLRGVFHSFTGTAGQARDIQAYGSFLLGINGIATFKNSGLREVLAQLSPEQLVVETDAPYLSPVPYRGKRNESSYLRKIVGQLAVVYGKTEEEIAAITTENTEKLFNFAQIAGKNAFKA